MNDEVKALMHKATESLEAATILKEEDFFDFSVSRAYYAMFYAAEALLLTKRLRFSKHQAVIAAFGKHFAKNNLLPKNFHRYLLDAFRDRLEGDYGPWGEITREMAEETLNNAKMFLDETSKFIKREGFDI